MGDEIKNPHLREVCQDGYVLKVTNRHKDFEILSIRFHIPMDLSLFFFQSFTRSLQAGFKRPLLHRCTESSDPAHGKGVFGDKISSNFSF